MDTLDLAATRTVAAPSSSLDRDALAAAPTDEPPVRRWPGWARLAILFGASVALWGVIAWAAFRVLKLG